MNPKAMLSSNQRTVTITMLYVGVLVVISNGIIGRVRDTVRNLSGNPAGVQPVFNPSPNQSVVPNYTTTPFWTGSQGPTQTPYPANNPWSHP